MTLFFIHIAKTAGGSLKKMLRDAGGDVRFHYHREEGFSPEFDYGSPAMVFGHYRFGAHAKAGKPPRYAVVLREPISRATSHFYHLKYVDRSPAGELARRCGDIDRFLAEGRHWEFDNGMCRAISGVSNQVPFGSVGVDVYDTAKANLEQYFEFIGLFEDMNDVVARLSMIVPGLGHDLPTVNKGKYERTLAPSTRALAERLNRLDQLLYQDAQRLLAPSQRNVEPSGLRTIYSSLF